ncbi:MAG TPA: sodium:solute symporter family protein [Gemmatimonadaceae bacterium]|nr:sodium:solute symporter family protein [Gemmatimonadaceae bacterium]
MTTLDITVVAVYMAATLALGLWLSRRASRSLEEFFVGGRSIPWWLAGASMAAITFNVDTPLYVSGLVIGRGIAGNWEWWAFVVAHVAMIYLFARLWRRAGILTDVELIEARYGGRPAALLRGARAFLFALPINAVGIAYGMLAMRKVVDALGLWESVGMASGQQRLWTVIAIAGVVLVYAAFSGLWGVVATDFFQLVLALVGAVVVAWYALAEVGGLAALPERVAAAGKADRLAFFPSVGSALLPLPSFVAYVAVQWWAYRNADGGGVFVQRLVSVPSERDAERAAWLFNILNYVVRAWPWILCALVALVVLPDLDDPETAYPLLMRRYLPAGVLGLVFASLLAAFMSTVSAQVNWGASYLVNDVWRRFVRPGASERELVWAGRAASVLITAVASYVAFHTESIREVFRFLIVLGTGSGLVLILRWFWWRINAWAEIAALLGGVVVAVLSYTLPRYRGLEYGVREIWTALIVTALWVVVMYATPAESAATLDRFYARARPGGAWGPVRARTGLAPWQNLADDVRRTVAGVAALLGGTIALGAAALQRWGLAVGAAAVAAAGVAVLARRRTIHEEAGRV